MMMNRNRTVFGKLITKGILFLAERLLRNVPVIGPMFRVAMFVLG